MSDVPLSGGDAYIAGFSENDCPYREDYECGDYWESPAGLRQRWLSEWRYAHRANTLFK